MNTYLREATEKDIDILFQWANDSDVRKNSFSTKEILYKEHQNWYKEILSSTECKQYIYICDEVAIGQARITIFKDEAEIGYSICKEKRCMGYGKDLLRLLRKRVKDDFPNILKLIAKVKPDNIASQQILLDMGYIEKFSFFELNLLKDSILEDIEDKWFSRGGYYS